MLHVTASLSPVHGGTTSAVLEMIAGLDAQGVACEVATSDDDGPGRRIADDAPERQHTGRHYFPKRSDFYVYAPDMAPWLDVHLRDYDLVHIHGLFSHLNGLAGRLCRRHRVPYIVTPHGMANRYGMRYKPLRKKLSFALVERALLEGAAAIHMTSRGEECDFADLGINTPVARIPLAVSPVSPGDGTAFRARHPEIGDSRIAVFMGRLNPIKNLEAAVEALALPSGVGFHLAVCGDGPDQYVKALKARAAACGVGDRISWLGFVSGQDKADALAAGCVYVQPSMSESFGVAAVEAVSAGLHCVLGENVGVAEDLVAAGFAVAVPPTGEGVAVGLSKVSTSTVEKQELAIRGQAFVASAFDPDLISAEITALYMRVARRVTSRIA